MNEFAQTFLNEDWESLAGAPRVYIGAFGKHPGWNDHLDDIGLVTASLVAARRVIYGKGIASQIESAAWDKAGAEKTLAAFDHIFLWRRPGECLVGLIWASRDGKGRALYPMILCAHCVGQAFEWIASRVLPALEEAAAKCRETTSAEEVLRVLNATQRELREDSATTREGVSTADSALGVARWAGHYAAVRTPLFRLFHHMESQFERFAPGSGAWAERDGDPDGSVHSRHLRVPVTPGATPVESLNAWAGFLATQIDPASPVLAVIPRGEAWVDLIAGEPAATDLFVLRATPAAVPLVTEIPYQIEDGLRAKLLSIFEALGQGRLPDYSFLNGDPLDENRTAADKWLAKFRPGARRGFLGRLFKSGGSRGGTRFEVRR